MSNITKDDYLREDFDYTKLTKQELRLIMQDNGITDIPPVNAKKQTIIDAYKISIHDRIKEIKRNNFDDENIFQTSKPNESSCEKYNKSLDKIDKNIDSQKNEHTIIRKNNSSKNITKRDDSINMNHSYVSNKENTSKDDIINKNNGDDSINRNHSYVSAKDSSYNSNTNSSRINISVTDGNYISNTNNSHINSSGIDSNYISNTNNSHINSSDIDSNYISNTNNSHINSSDANIDHTYVSIKDSSYITSNEDNNKKHIDSKYNSQISNKDISKTSNEYKSKSAFSKYKKYKNHSINNTNTGISSFLKNDKTEEVDDFPSKRKKIVKTLISRRRKISFRSIFNFIITLFIVFLIYLRFFCPYCGTGYDFCVPLPKNTYLDSSGKLQPIPGYKIRYSIITHAVVDNSDITEKKKIVKKIIRMLEYLKGAQSYNFQTSTVVYIDNLTNDLSIIHALEKDSRVIIEKDGKIFAKYSRVAFSIYVKFYLFKISKFLLPSLLAILLIKFFIYKRNKNLLFKKQASAISKEVFDILLRHIISSEKSVIFKPYVYETQLKEALEVPPHLWAAVKEIVEKNSNVSTKVDEMNKVRWEWIGPVIQK